MADDLVLYTHPMSRGRIARWMLEEVGRPYRIESLDYSGAMKSPAFLAVNPMGKVPALVHDGVVVTETAAICAYLADAFPEAGLAPAPSDPTRGAYYRWLFFAAGPVEHAVTNAGLKVVVPPGKERMAGYGSLAVTLDTLEAAVTGREYLAGDRFSAADVYAGSQIGFGLQFRSMEARPAFVTYWERLTARPAYKRAAELDNALMPAPA